MKLSKASILLTLSISVLAAGAASRIYQKKSEKTTKITAVSSTTNNDYKPGSINLVLAQSQTTIPVSMDTYLNGPDPSTNLGSSTGLTVKQTNASDNTYNRIGLLQFDISGIDQNKGRITKAELKLYFKATDAMNSATKKKNFDDTPYIVAYSKVDDWTESGATWNNYASFAQSAAEISRVLGKNIPYTQVNSTNWTIVPNVEVKWDITSTVRKDFIKDNGKKLTLTLTSTSVSANMGATIHSKDNGNPAYIPVIEITQDSEQAFSLPEDNEQNDYDKIISNVQNMLYDEAGNYNTISTNAQNYLNTIDNNGAWSTLSYTGDVPTAHLDRLKTMALAYTNSQSSLFENVSLQTAIVNGLQKWYNANPDHSNWFYDQIAYPQRIGQVLILMRNGAIPVPMSLELNILARMKSQGGAPDQGGSQGTGANKMNIAMHWVYRGALLEDKGVTDKGVQQTFYPMFLTTGEGLQYDYSYLQHGQQLYIGGYGWDIVNGITNVALYTLGTNYSLAVQQRDYLSSFVRQAYLRVIRGQNFMFNAFGRGIARENGSGQSGFPTLLERMKIIDPVYTNTYNDAIARLKNQQNAGYGVETAHTHFYSSDYTLQTNPNFTFDVRGVSKRTLRNENGNGENLRGYFLSDGATAIAITGTEYVNIYPTWDWSMIPGVTARQGTMVYPAQWGTSGTTDFVGGVSDTLRGISVYDLDNNSTKAKKAYFFFDNEVVCLGSGISTSAGTQEVNTTLNQVLLQSDVTTETTDGTVTTHNGNNTSLDYSGNLKWAMQGGVGYVLPQGGNVGLTAQSQTGSWSSITTGASSTPVNKDVFKLWLKHGVSPSNQSYAYIVVPNKNTAIQMQDYVAKQDIDILENSTNIQAVRHKSLDLHSFVFLNDGQTYTNDSISISTDKACLVMVQPLANGKLKLNVADPTKKLSNVTVNVKWTNDFNPTTATISLPSGVYAGKSVVQNIQRPNVLPLNIISFNAKLTLDGVQLNWTSNQEDNTDYIEIWRNEANQPGVLVGRVNAKNSEGINLYSYIDRSAPNAVLYYQLNVVDKDGKSNRSKIVTINNQLKYAVRVYPNPANSYLNVQTDKKELVKLYNNLGMVVLQSEIDKQGKLNVSQLAEGVYFLKTSTQVQKILIKH